MNQQSRTTDGAAETSSCTLHPYIPLIQGRALGAGTVYASLTPLRDQWILLQTLDDQTVKTYDAPTFGCLLTSSHVHPSRPVRRNKFLMLSWRNCQLSPS